MKTYSSTECVLELRVTGLLLFADNGMRRLVSDKDFAVLAALAGIRVGFFIKFSLSSLDDI